MISLIFLIFAAICSSIMDVVSFRYDLSVFRNLNKEFWNPSYSWRNKWKNGDPNQGEKFFGSSTFLVLFTDSWHLFKSLMILFVALAITSYTEITKYLILDIFIYRIAFGLIFEIFFSKLWRVKK